MTTQRLRKKCKQMIEPQGKSRLFDAAVLRGWEAYALTQKIANQFRKPFSIPKIKLDETTRNTPTNLNSEFFKTHLLQSILPFWEKHSLDKTYGGFVTHLDRKGRIFQDHLKLSPMQGRMIYAFCVGYELEGDVSRLQIADDGVRFLLDHYWDDHHGGWFRGVNRTGDVVDTDKHLFDQAYVLVGLTEYYRVTKDESVLRFIMKTVDVVNAKGRDHKHAGYFERCARDWAQISLKKTICVQLDVLVAMLFLYELDGADRFLERMIEIADLIVNRMIDKNHGCLLETFHRKWLYNPLLTRDRIEVGHNLKGAWLLLEIYRITREEEYFKTAARLIDYCLTHAWDHRNHGFFHDLHRNGLLSTSEKLWWPECEGIAALLLIHRITGDPRYLEYFEKLTNFCLSNFFDPEYGEWYATCYADGTVKDSRKGYDWKAAFHTAHACYYAHRYLAETITLPVA